MALTEEELTGGAAGEERMKVLADELEGTMRSHLSRNLAEFSMKCGDVVGDVAVRLAQGNPCLALLLRAYSVAAASIAASTLTPLALAELGRKSAEDVENLRVSAILLRRSADMLDQFLATKN